MSVRVSLGSVILIGCASATATLNSKLEKASQTLKNALIKEESREGIPNVELCVDDVIARSLRRPKGVDGDEAIRCFEEGLLRRIFLPSVEKFSSQ